MKHVGILTSGGDAPGLNAAIRTFVKIAVHRYGMKVTGIEQGYRGLIESQYRQLDEYSVEDILTQGGTVLGISREKPFRHKSAAGDFYEADRIKQNYHDLQLDCLIVIGGNGSQKSAAYLAAAGLNVIGIPKTIDNDIAENDVSFGFNTAYSIGARALDCMHATAESHRRIMVVETMGHKTGWLALYSGIAGGSDVIIIPEIPYTLAKLTDHIKKRFDAGKRFSVVAISEGARSVEDQTLTKKALRKKHRNQLCSAGHRLAAELNGIEQFNARATVLGYLQRGGSPSAYDRILAGQFAAAAAEYSAQGIYGVLTAFQNGRIVPIPLHRVAENIKKVPYDDSMITIAKNMGVCFGD